MQAMLLALLVSASATTSQMPVRLHADEVSKKDTRYIEGLRRSFRAFEVHTARFIQLVNGPYVKKSPEELKKLEAALLALQQGDRAIQSLRPPVRVGADHRRLEKGCDQIVQGARIFFDLHRTRNPNAQQMLLHASQCFRTGSSEIKAANEAIGSAWNKQLK